MTYDSILPGTFLARPNRFIALVALAGGECRCHVKNTGRLAELLLPGARVLVRHAPGPQRKTDYDLIAVYKGDVLFNIDSGAPNRVCAEWLAQSTHFGRILSLRAEVRRGASRLDFYAETDRGGLYVETKGVTLERDGIALFPDAPTLRGLRHVNELAACPAAGLQAAVVFILQFQGARLFTPNAATQPAFAQALAAAARQGVQVLALGCRVTPTTITAAAPVPVRL